MRSARPRCRTARTPDERLGSAKDSLSDFFWDSLVRGDSCSSYVEETPTMPLNPPETWLTCHMAHPGPGGAVLGDPNPAFYYKGRYLLSAKAYWPGRTFSRALSRRQVIVKTTATN